jgi:Zn-dependent protease
MKQTFRLGRIGGVPVGAHWSAVATLTLVTAILAAGVLPGSATGWSLVASWAAAAVAAVVFLGSVLAHETAHAVVARRHGVPVRSVTLWMLGGVAELAEEPRSPRADLEIAVAGPLASLAAAVAFGLGVVGATVLGAPDVLVRTLGWLAATNTLLAVFNLLPAAPLDGGRVLRAVLWWITGNQARAASVATHAGRVLGVVLGGLGVLELLVLQAPAGLWLAFLGWFIASAATAEDRTRGIGAATRGLSVRDVMTPEPVVGRADLSVATFIAEVVLPSRQTEFPVVDGVGALVGLVGVGALSQVPSSTRPFTQVGEVVTPLSSARVAAPDEPLAHLLERWPRSAASGAALVLDSGVLVGLVTAEDIRRCFARGRLRMAGITA